MNDADLRLECLRLANSVGGGHHWSQVVDRARAYAEFVLGNAEPIVTPVIVEVERTAYPSDAPLRAEAWVPPAVR